MYNIIDSGKLEKTAKGVYILRETWEDEFINLQLRFKKGIFSNETALFLWDLTDRIPNRYNMTFPETYNLTNAKKEDINCSTVKKEWYLYCTPKTFTVTYAAFLSSLKKAKVFSPMGTRLWKRWTPFPINRFIFCLFFPSVLLIMESIFCLFFYIVPSVLQHP